MLLYGAALTALAGPLLLTLRDVKAVELARDAPRPDAWPFWAVIGVLTVLEGLALLVPVRIAQARPVTRGPWITLAVVSGLLMSLLLTTGTLSLAEGIWKNDVPLGFGWTALACLGAGWLVWALVFARLRRGRDDRQALDGVVRRLVTGSLAELLVAVPCHILVRKKEYCCAGYLTFAGLAAGFAVLLFAFGPAVYFLFVDRLRRLHALTK
jgi:hypothetical protein